MGVGSAVTGPYTQNKFFRKRMKLRLGVQKGKSAPTPKMIVKVLTRKQRKNDADRRIKMEALEKENSVILV